MTILRWKQHQEAGNGHDALRHARSLVARGLKGVHIRVTDHRSLSGKGDWRYTIWSERAAWREKQEKLSFDARSELADRRDVPRGGTP